MEIAQAPQERRTRTDRRVHVPLPVSHAIQAALERGEIEILFQPQFACGDGALVGAEALARWRHPEHGLLGADVLFAQAAQAGMVREVSRHVARAALATAGTWRGPLHLSLNVTAEDVAAGNFAETLTGAVAEVGFLPEHLTLEITEQVLVRDLERTAARLQHLAALGMRIALDDFGAGFCNFGYLKVLPLHGLKLDRSMVEGIDENPRDLAVLRGILAMAFALALEVTAEGIERRAQLEAIVSEGCTTWQGFLGGAPLTAGEFAALSASRPLPHGLGKDLAHHV